LTEAVKGTDPPPVLEQAKGFQAHASRALVEDDSIEETEE
jgi:hypothetical protein